MREPSGPAAVPPSPSPLASGLTSPELDAVKGLFIVLIVLGHNSLATGAVPLLSQQLYNFHVHAFLLLPFLTPSRPFSWGFVRDRASRYLVPHVAFYGLAAVLLLLLLHKGVGAWARDALVGLLLGTADPIKRGCGFALYWFLPTLLVLVVMRAALRDAPPAAGAAALAAALGFHAGVGALPLHDKALLWFGSGIALFVWPLGVAVERVWAARHRLSRGALAVVAAAVFVALLATASNLESGVRLARLLVYDLSRPGLLFLHAALPVAALVAAAAGAGALARVPGLVVFGRHSLFVYLVHSLVFRALLRVVPASGAHRAQDLGWAAATFAATLAVSLAIARGLQGNPALRRLLAPRSWSEWPLAPRRESGAAGDARRP
jgi:fucose 4-O-acetylase-like acetyltransferase